MITSFEVFPFLLGGRQGKDETPWYMEVITAPKRALSVGEGCSFTGILRVLLGFRNGGSQPRVWIVIRECPFPLAGSELQFLPAQFLSWLSFLVLLPSAVELADVLVKEEADIRLPCFHSHGPSSLCAFKAESLLTSFSIVLKFSVATVGLV